SLASLPGQTTERRMAERYWPLLQKPACCRSKPTVSSSSSGLRGSTFACKDRSSLVRIYSFSWPLSRSHRLRCDVLVVISLGEKPSCEAQCVRALNVANTSRAKTLRGSFGSPWCQWLDARTKTIHTEAAKNVPRNMIRRRGGNDFFSGTVAGSRVLTLGVSFASCTLASSYCSVSSS